MIGVGRIDPTKNEILIERKQNPKKVGESY